MQNNVIAIYNKDNKSKDYKILLVIKKEEPYIIYTDINNFNLKENLYAIKVDNYPNINKIIPITDKEWQMIEEEYQGTLKKLRLKEFN